MIQIIFTFIIGIFATIYVGKKIVKQFTKIENDPKCDNCPVSDILKEKKY